MGLFDKLFDRNGRSETKRADAIIKKNSKNFREMQGALETATLGAHVRSRFFSVVKEVEAKLDGPAIGYAAAEGMLMVHPKLEEELRKQPDADALEAALTKCFITPEAQQKFNQSWSSLVYEYRNETNTEEMLRKKSSALSAYIVINLDFSQFPKDDSSHEQDCIARVEEAAVWFRVIDELAFRFIPDKRRAFIDFLQDELALDLALLGTAPDVIQGTMAARTREYGKFRAWLPRNGGAKDTLFWEAAKHVGEPTGLGTDPIFQFEFSARFCKKLNAAMVRELLVGEGD